MPETRRSFLYSTSAAAAGAASPAFAGAIDGPGQLASKPYPLSPIQVPKMKFGKAEIGRLICGTNQFYGYAHFNQILSTVMKDYYTPERVCDVLHQCVRYGINAFNYFPGPRSQQDLEMFQAQGGKIHLICQGVADPVPGKRFNAARKASSVCASPLLPTSSNRCSAPAGVSHNSTRTL